MLNRTGLKKVQGRRAEEVEESCPQDLLKSSHRSSRHNSNNSSSNRLHSLSLLLPLLLSLSNSSSHSRRRRSNRRPPRPPSTLTSPRLSPPQPLRISRDRRRLFPPSRRPTWTSPQRASRRQRRRRTALWVQSCGRTRLQAQLFFPTSRSVSGQVFPTESPQCFWLAREAQSK